MTPDTQPVIGGIPEAHILIVEDEPLIRLLLAETLRDAGAEVTEAADADAAALLLQRARFDLLLSDIYMPGRRNGIDLAHYARLRDPTIRIVLATGRPDALDEHVTPSLCEARLSKPFSPFHALQVVTDVLAAKPAAPPPLVR